MWDNQQMDMIERLDRYQKVNGLKAADMARLFDVVPQKYNNWRYRNSLPKEFYSCAENLLSTNKLEEVSAAYTPGDHFISIINVMGGLGSGVINTEHEEVVDVVRISKRFITENMKVTSAQNLRIITGSGDSMKGTVNNGDPVFIDIGVTKIDGDGIYAILTGDRLAIKRIQTKVNGDLLVISDNKTYPPEAVSKKDFAEIRICGRVVHVWNGNSLY